MPRLLCPRAVTAACVVVFALVAGRGSASASPEPTSPAQLPTPVVFHTDIGTDIDDTWALAQLLRSPELDLKLVLVDAGDTRYRAKVAAKVLARAGRTDVPIGLGVTRPLAESGENQGPWVKTFDLSQYPGRVVEDGVGELIRTVRNSPRTVTIISVGAVPAIAAALARDPELPRRARFVGMHGSFDIGYGGGPPSAESNVKLDPAAFRTVLAAPWQDILLTPLDTCGSVELKGDRYHAIWCATADPLLRAVIEGYCIYAPHQQWFECDFFATRSSTLFDCVAVYLAHAEDLVDVEPLRCVVTDDGFTRRDPAGAPVRVALRWKDRDAFEAGLTRRLLGRVPPQRGHGPAAADAR